MIEIKIEAASGAEARAELLNLLGITPGALITMPTLNPEQKQEIKEQLQVVATVAGTDVTTQTRKRRTQAEIKAEEAAKTETPAQEETPVDNEPDTSQAPPGPVEATKEVPTLQDLQRECAILVRAGFKEKGVEFIKTIGGAENSKEVPEEKREAVIAAMAAFIEENKISR